MTISQKKSVNNIIKKKTIYSRFYENRHPPLMDLFHEFLFFRATQQHGWVFLLCMTRLRWAIPPTRWYVRWTCHIGGHYHDTCIPWPPPISFSYVSPHPQWGSLMFALLQYWYTNILILQPGNVYFVLYSVIFQNAF